MIETRNNKFANGFRWAWKLSLVVFALAVGEIAIGLYTGILTNIKQDIDIIIGLPFIALIGFITGYFFAKDV